MGIERITVPVAIALSQIGGGNADVPNNFGVPLPEDPGHTLVTDEYQNEDNLTPEDLVALGICGTLGLAGLVTGVFVIARSRSESNASIHEIDPDYFTGPNGEDFVRIAPGEFRSEDEY